MRLFINSNDYVLWDIIEEDPSIPIKQERDRQVPKKRNEKTDKERKRMSTNDKALHILFCALGPDIYSKMSSCTSAKEV